MQGLGDTVTRPPSWTARSLRRRSSPLVREASSRFGALCALLTCGGCVTDTATDARALRGGNTSSHASVERVASELERLTGRLTDEQRDTFRGVLSDTIEKDAYVCLPPPNEVFFGNAAVGGRLIAGAMPHYGFFFGPMRYAASRDRGWWRVELIVAVEPPTREVTLELPDCALRSELEGDVRCSGVPYSQSGSTAACPKAGVFRAPGTPKNVRALLAHWSRAIEVYWTRDAARYGLPIRYDFEFVLADEAPSRASRVDIRLPLSPTCGRTPYFAAIRSGWSLPVLAHEVGHLLGLLDEYETFSGIVSAYPKTPFPGAEISRMGLSMREGTLLLPVHHYLVLRRWFCPEPSARDPFGHALP
jgi:hypothetical protein